MKFEIYQSRNKQWRWRLKASNGKIIANSGESYKNRKHCWRMVMKMRYDVGPETRVVHL